VADHVVGHVADHVTDLCLPSILALDVRQGAR
jgi:hypothetical protein